MFAKPLIILVDLLWILSNLPPSFLMSPTSAEVLQIGELFLAAEVT